MMAARSPISVVIPTIGRPDLLHSCLTSIAACTPPPAEIVIVDQSRTPATEKVVEEFASAGARLVSSQDEGVAAANNLGLENAHQEFVAITHDDCTVSEDWVYTAAKLMSQAPTAIHTGSVHPVGDPWAVPSTIEDTVPRDYTGHTRCRVLYPNNMVCPRSLVLALGGFDPRFPPTLPAEDNDLCYRWLRAGNALRYEPKLRVWHHDWRSPEQLRQLYRSYGRGQGAFYAKHLRRRDLRVLRFMGEDLVGTARATASAAVRGQPRRAAAPWRTLRGIPGGLVQGWQDFAGSGSRANGSR
jgi:GT2 family glycosyltransferase